MFEFIIVSGDCAFVCAVIWSRTISADPTTATKTLRNVSNAKNCVKSALTCLPPRFPPIVGSKGKLVEVRCSTGVEESVRVQLVWGRDSPKIFDVKSAEDLKLTHGILMRLVRSVARDEILSQVINQNPSTMLSAP